MDHASESVLPFAVPLYYVDSNRLPLRAPCNSMTDSPATLSPNISTPRDMSCESHESQPWFSRHHGLTRSRKCHNLHGYDGHDVPQELMLKQQVPPPRHPTECLGNLGRIRSEISLLSDETWLYSQHPPNVASAPIHAAPGFEPSICRTSFESENVDYACSVGSNGHKRQHEDNAWNATKRACTADY